MEEWKAYKVHELGRVVTGKTPKTAEPENYGGDIPFLTPSDDMTAKYVFSTGKTITQKGADSVKGAIIPSGSVCVSCIGSDLGKAVITTRETVTNQQINSVIVNTEKFNVDFVYYAMVLLGKQLNYHSKTSTAVPIVNKSQFSKYEICCPSLDTQCKVSKVLSTIDEAIDENLRVNEILQKQVHAIYDEWFVRFAPFGNVAPSSWVRGKLKDVLRLNKRPIKAGERLDLPYLPIDTIPMRSFAVMDARPNEEAQSSLITFNRDDIIVGAMRVYFHRVIIAPFDGITRTTCFTLTPYQKEYLCYGLITCDLDSSIEQANNTSKGSTMPYAVWDGGMGEIEVVIPPKDVALRFNTCVLPLIRKIQDSYFEIKTLVELRDILMPKLMSGSIDVSGIVI